MARERLEVRGVIEVVVHGAVRRNVVALDIGRREEENFDLNISFLPGINYTTLSTLHHIERMLPTDNDATKSPVCKASVGCVRQVETCHVV